MNIVNILLQASIIGVLAVGTTVVLITEEIDLSIGAVEGFTAIIVGITVVDGGAPWPIGVLAAFGCGLAVGAVNGFFTTVIGVPSFIATLAMLGIASGLAFKITEGRTLRGFPSAYQQIGQGKVAGIPGPVIVAFGVALVMYLMLRYTRAGMNFYAVGGNREAAALAGIRPRVVKTLALIISGGCAGIAGILVSARLDAANASFGANDLLNAIAAVVIGGTALTGGVGSMIGTVLGVLLIVTIQNGLTLVGVSPFWQTTAVGAIILGAATLDRTSRGRGAT